MILRREALQKWKSRLGAAATPRALITAFLDAGADAKYVDVVCNVLGKKLKSHGMCIHVARCRLNI